MPRFDTLPRAEKQTHTHTHISRRGGDNQLSFAGEELGLMVQHKLKVARPNGALLRETLGVHRDVPRLAKRRKTPGQALESYSFRLHTYWQASPQKATSTELHPVQKWSTQNQVEN